MHCCLWFRSVFRVQSPWPKRYGYHLSKYSNGSIINSGGSSNEMYSTYIYREKSEESVDMLYVKYTDRRFH